MNLAELIKQLQDSRQKALNDQRAIAKDAADAGRTMTDDERKRYDALQLELDAAKADIQRYQRLQEADAATAKEVTGDEKAAQTVRTGATAKNTQTLEPGIAFARAVRCLGLGAIERRDATQVAKSLYGDRPEIVATTTALQTKAAVDPATTDNASFAGNLVNGQPAADFIAYLLPQTLIGRLSMRTVPFRQPIISQDSIGKGSWVGEAQPIPATSQSFSKKSMEPLKVAALAVASMETLRDSSPAADALIRDSLADAMRFRLDTDFIDPANAGTANVKPASITYGINNTHAASGKDAAAVRKDLKALFADFIAQNRDVASATFVTDPATALALALMTNSDGVKFFPGMTLQGGELLGLPVAASQYVPTKTSGSPAVTTHSIYLLDASNIYYNAGGLQVDMSSEASVELNDAPKGDGTGSLVSLWQNDLTGFRVTMAANWAQRRTDSVSSITGAQYGE